MATVKERSKDTGIPQTILRSDQHAQDIWKETHDSAVKEYGEGGRAHRVAYASLKHQYEKKGDRWAPEGMEIITAGTDLATGSRTVTYGQDYTGQLCVFADRKEQVLVGAWAVGPLASEWIQFATLAIRARVPISVLDDTMLAFPTFMREYMYPLHQLKTQL